jgi:hypothetical protein
MTAITQTSPSHKTNLNFGDMSLLGFDWYRTAQQPGDSLVLKTYWQARAEVRQEYQVIARLSDQNGKVIQENKLPLRFDDLASSSSEKGREALRFIEVALPHQIESGNYKLSLTLQAEGLKEVIFSDFPPVMISARARSYSAPQPTYSTTARFGSLVELLGYELQTNPNEAIIEGQTLQLTLYWKALQETSESYKVFIHLVGTDGLIYGQIDALPLNGKAPTNEWGADEVITDQYKVPVKPGAPADQYQVVIGFYKPSDGGRLPLAGGGGESLVLTILRGK